MAILITGAQGQLGRALRAALTERVVACGKAELDITRLDVVRAAIDQLRPRIVINAAAFTHVDIAGVLRSIPACTGEPASRRLGCRLHGVYPRVYGGTLNCPALCYTGQGLSPRGYCLNSATIGF